MDRITEKIISLLNANVKIPRGINQIYDGDIFLIPKNSIPAIIVNPNSTAIQTKTNTQDQDVYTIDITLILDARDYFNQSATIKSGLAILKKTMEERKSGTSNELKTDTIAYTVRNYLDSDSDYSLRADSGIIYGFNDQREFPTVEANLQVQVFSKVYTR